MSRGLKAAVPELHMTGDVSYVKYDIDVERSPQKGTRTVRLDDEAERTRKRLRNMTGLSISEVLKQGLGAYERQAFEQTNRKPYAIYRELDLGAGGYAVAAAREAKSAVAVAIRRKHRR